MKSTNERQQQNHLRQDTLQVCTHIPDQGRAHAPGPHPIGPRPASEGRGDHALQPRLAGQQAFTVTGNERALRMGASLATVPTPSTPLRALRPPLKPDFWEDVRLSSPPAHRLGETLRRLRLGPEPVAVHQTTSSSQKSSFQRPERYLEKSLSKYTILHFHVYFIHTK